MGRANTDHEIPSKDQTNEQESLRILRGSFGSRAPPGRQAVGEEEEDRCECASVQLGHWGRGKNAERKDARSLCDWTRDEAI